MHSGRPRRKPPAGRPTSRSARPFCWRPASAFRVSSIPDWTRPVWARSGAEISPATAGKFVTSALSSVAAYSLGSKILTWAALPVLAAFPVAGIPAAIGMNAALNALFTYRLGKECVRRFSDPRFTSSDVITLGRLLVSIPNTSEIRDLKRLISGD
jgi:hypothetical protein